MGYITSIGTANPTNCVQQSVIANFMVKAMQLNEEEARRLRILYRATGIDHRYSVLIDYGKTNELQFYSNTKNLEPFPTTRQRMDVFRRESVNLSLMAVKNCLDKNPISIDQITHLVVVSCTGMYAPGLDIDLVKTLKLNPSIRRTCINFMGCYAAFNAIKLGEAFCNENCDHKILIVCTELCSLHFQKENTQDNWLANALFADGSAAVLMEAQTKSKIKLRSVSFYCDLSAEAENDMAWNIGDFGFEMKLSSYVPEAIQKGIKQLTTKLFSKIDLSISDVSFFAIHPGGRKILEVIEEELVLTKEKTKSSHKILRDFGNMSSPTVLFVLKEILDDLTMEDRSKKILSFAFGPGLTMESMLLEIEMD